MPSPDIKRIALLKISAGHVAGGFCGIIAQQGRAGLEKDSSLFRYRAKRADTSSQKEGCAHARRDAYDAGDTQNLVNEVIITVDNIIPRGD